MFISFMYHTIFLLFKAVEGHNNTKFGRGGGAGVPHILPTIMYVYVTAISYTIIIQFFHQMN